MVHRTQEGVALDAERLEQRHDRVGVVLTEHVRLQEAQEQEIVAVFSNGVVDEAVGDGDLAPALAHRYHRAVPGEIQEIARPGQLPELRGAEVTLQAGQSEAADTADVDPRTDHGPGVGVLEIRHRRADFECAYPHGPILAGGPR